jgi:hypothetical protein
MWRSQWERNSMICGLRIAPGNRRKQKFHHVPPAIADNIFPLK